MLKIYLYYQQMEEEWDFSGGMGPEGLFSVHVLLQARADIKHFQLLLLCCARRRGGLGDADRELGRYIKVSTTYNAEIFMNLL